MQIGKVLHLSLRDSEEEEQAEYRCNIIGKDEDYLYVDYPIDVATSKTKQIANGTVLKAVYIDKDHVPLSFTTEVVRRVKQRVPAIALKMPGTDEIKRVQRREYVRVQTAIDVAVHSKEHVFYPFTTVTSDISGGGVSLVLPTDVALEAEAGLVLWLVLPSNTDGMTYIQVEGIVVREKVDDHDIRTASVRFINLSNAERQKIIAFSFEKQREARSKGLTI